MRTCGPFVHLFKSYAHGHSELACSLRGTLVAVAGEHASSLCPLFPPFYNPPVMLTDNTLSQAVEFW